MSKYITWKEKKVCEGKQRQFQKKAQPETETENARRNKKQASLMVSRQFETNREALAKRIKAYAKKTKAEFLKTEAEDERKVVGFLEMEAGVEEKKTDSV